MCGKLIVATTKNEINTLNQLFNRGKRKWDPKFKDYLKRSNQRV